MSDSAAAFAFGAKIEADYQGSGKWYPGSIMGVRPDGTYDILYNDGDGESEVPASRIRDPNAPETAVTNTAAPAAMATSASTGVIPTTSSSTSGSGSTSGGSSSSAAADGSSSAPWAVGQTVEVRHRGKTWRVAKVAEVDAELQCANVEFTDATLEKGVPFGLLRAPSAAGSAVPERSSKKSRSKSSSSSDKKSRRKKINAIYELCQNFSDAELDAATTMLLAVEALRVAQGGAPVAVAETS